MKISINLYLTTSKFAAYMILVIGSVFAFVNHDSGTLLATFSAVSAILMMKTYTTSKTEQATIMKGDQTTSTITTTTGNSPDVTTTTTMNSNNTSNNINQVPTLMDNS